MARVAVHFDGVSRGAVRAARETEMAIAGVGTSATKSGKRTSLFTGQLGLLGKAGFVAAGAAGLGLVVSQLSKSVAAAKDAEAAHARLTAALENANVSYDKHGNAIDAAIQKTSKLAALDDEDLSDAFAKLVRTTGDVEKATQGMSLAADIARARNISLEAATGFVEKAMNGQTRGLKSVGVEISKNTTGTEALERAQKKFAGSAVTYGNTAAGAQDKLKVAFENLQESVGTKLLPVMARLAIKLTELIEWSEKNWPKFQRDAEPVFQAVKVLVNNMIDRLQAIATTFEGVIKVIRGIRDGEWGTVWAGVKQVAVGAVESIVLTMVALPAKILGALSAKAFSGLSQIGAWIKNAVLSGIAGIGNGVLGMIEGAINRAIDLLNGAIRAYNAIPLAPNVATVGHVGGGSSPTAGAGKYPGRRASGGPVTGGSPYIVGERGPELFVPSLSGRIIPNDRVGGTQAPALVVHISVSGNTLLGDDSAMARELARRVEPELRRLISYQADR